MSSIVTDTNEISMLLKGLSIPDRHKLLYGSRHVDYSLNTNPFMDEDEIEENAEENAEEEEENVLEEISACYRIFQCSIRIDDPRFDKTYCRLNTMSRDRHNKLGRLGITSFEAARDKEWRQKEKWTHTLAILAAGDAESYKYKPNKLLVRLDAPSVSLLHDFDDISHWIHCILNKHNDNKVLIHCWAGISRSSTMLSAYLIRYFLFSARGAISYILRFRPVIRPNSGFVSQLQMYAEKQIAPTTATWLRHLIRSGEYVDECRFDSVCQYMWKIVCIKEPYSFHCIVEYIVSAVPIAQ